MVIPNPWDVFKESLKQLPEAMKWALGIAGIVALIAIVTGGWNVDPKIAVFGTIIMLVLMVVLVIFVRLSQTAAAQFRNIVLVFMWSSLSLTLATAVLLFTSVFFRWPLTFDGGEKLVRDGAVYTPAPGDPKVWGLQDQVNLLRGSWEALREYPATTSDVLERAEKLGEALMDVDDASLGPSGRVIKREYSCYAFIIVASTERYVSMKQQFADRAIAQCKSALNQQMSIRSKKDESANLRYTAAWIREKNEGPFTNYLLAMATCLKGTATADRATKLQAMDILKQVPTFYLERYPPNLDYTLMACRPE
jgi:hypothetical protein